MKCYEGRMETQTCVTCQQPKANLECVSCAGSVCKKCAEFLNQGSFVLSSEAPPVAVGTYCGSCFDTNVAPELEAYNDAATRARDINIYFKGQSKESRVIRRKEKPIKIDNCPDREEAILRLAFLAAKANYNVLLDVDVYAQKVKIDGYQTSNWKGIGIPANVDPRILERT